MVDAWALLEDLEASTANTSGYIERDGFGSPVFDRMAGAFIATSDAARAGIAPDSQDARDFAERLEAAWEDLALGISGADEDRLWKLLQVLHPELYDQMLDAQQVAAATKGWLLELRSEDVTWSPWLPAVEDLPGAPEQPVMPKSGMLETVAVLGIGAIVLVALAGRQ